MNLNAARPLAAMVGMVAPQNVTLAIIGYNPLRRGEAIVYRLIDHSGACVYIGYTASPLNRWQAHSRKPWWHEVAAIYYVRGLHDRRARDIEYADIHAERPKYNRTVNH